MTKGQTKSVKATLENDLAKLSKGELVELVVRLSEEHPEVERKLAIRFVEAGSGEAIKQYKALMRESIKSFSDRHGFVPYRSVYGAISGAEKVMEAGSEAKERGDHIAAAEIALCVMHEMSRLMNRCDDSGGSVGGLIKEGLELLLSLAGQAEDMEAGIRSSLLKLLLKEAKHSDWDGWDEWRLSLLESASLLISGEKERGLWTKALDDWDASRRHSEYTDRYSGGKLAELRYSVILRFDGDEQARQYVEEHLEIEFFRDIAIEDATAKGQYDRAFALIEQGERQDRQRNFPGLVHHWEEKRVRLYELTGRSEELVEITRKFMFEGEYAYYLKLKELTPGAEWEANHDALLDEIQSKGDRSWQTESMYNKIIVQEGLWGRLLKVARERPRLIEHYYSHLVKDYFDETMDLFEAHIKEECKQATERKGYKKACRIIRTMIEAGGKERAIKLVSELRAAYPRRPALLEELGKIKGLN